MSRMICKCGATLGTSISPSPYSLFIYYNFEVQSAIIENPEILLSDFLNDWDELNGGQKEFMKRSEKVEYWWCTECQRVYETQARIGGHWLRVYQRTEHSSSNISIKDWTRIYVLNDIETDATLEESPKILLSDYLKMHAEIQYLLSPDESIVIALDAKDQKVLYSYVQEKINTENIT